MTYTTETFETGSEFFVKWTEFNADGSVMQRKSEIFSTYEDADAVNVATGSDQNRPYSNRNIMVRRPGNKNYTMALLAKKA